MARRENQGLHIGLIVMVVVSVLLLGLTYYFWSNSDTLKKDLEAKNSELAQARSAQSTASNENVRYREMIGVSGDASLESVEAQFQQEAGSILSSYPEADRSFLEGLKNLRGALFDTKKQVDDLTKQVESLTTRLDAVRTEEAARVEEATNAQRAAVDDLAKERAAFEKARAEHLATTDQLNDQLNKLRSEVQDAQNRSRQEVAQAKNGQDRLTIQLDRMRTQLDEYRKETFDVADGLISYYNARTDLVTINRGSEDGLRARTSFGVFDQSDNNMARAAKKGTIEVQRILGPHLAEARVIEDSAANPIIAGDLIYTPLWAPGGRLHFGIVGFIDLDGDGQDDREMLRQMIRSSGGVIDAEDNVDSQGAGELSLQTRYLIVGDQHRSDASEGVRVQLQQRQVRRYSELVRQAGELGIERITVQQVVNYLGYKAISAGLIEAIDG